MTNQNPYQSLFHKHKERTLIQRVEPLHLRVDRLKKLENWLLSHRGAIAEALYSDFNKNAVEADITEVYQITTEIKHTLKHLSAWVKNKPIKTPLTFWGTRAFIQYEPKGVCLIISPWNYPLNLALGPLVSCLAAGNTAILKPSELTPATSKLIKQMAESLFTDEEVAVVEGGVEETTHLLALPFDHIFFTGSPAVGKIVMKAASEHLSSVTLELGGKSPVIIDSSADIKDAAYKIAWGKGINNGQTCVAPDYLLVHESVEQKFIEAYKKSVAKIYGGTGLSLKSNPDYCRIVNPKNVQRLLDLWEEALAHPHQVGLPMIAEPNERFISPALIKSVPQSKIMQEEIFGPLLPYITYSDLDEAIAHINALPKPLGLYVFSKDSFVNQKVARETSAGALVINDCMLQFTYPEVPFGGIGNSGQGKAHGFYGFRAFSNEKPVIKQRIGFTTVSPLFPPYGKRSKTLMNALIKYF